MVDRGYRGVTITRTVAYDRIEDVLLVWDRLTSASTVRAGQQWGLGRTRDVTIDADAAHSNGPGANVSMLFTSGGAPLDVAKGERSPLRGWNSEAYGEFAPAPSVRASQSGTDLSWLTVIAPRAADVPASSVSATSAVSGDAASVALSTTSGVRPHPARPQRREPQQDRGSRADPHHDRRRRAVGNADHHARQRSPAGTARLAPGNGARVGAAPGGRPVLCFGCRDGRVHGARLRNG